MDGFGFGFLKDISHALRSLRHSPGFLITAVAALALGIGANTAVFSVINAVILKPLPFPDADRIVLFQITSPQGRFAAASPAKYQHWQNQTDVVHDVAAYRLGVVNDTGGDRPEQLAWSQVSDEYFRLFGAPIIQGRSFTPEEDLPNGGRVALISEQLWSLRYDRDPDTVGQAILLSGEAYTIIGIVGETFDFTDFGDAPQVWTPFQLEPNSSDQGHYFQSAGRLNDGVSLAQADSRLDYSTEEFARRFPDSVGDGTRFGVDTLREGSVNPNARASLLVLVGAVALVLLIACANVASLLLVRATGRKREIALRAALGAGRGRIIRQLLTESVLLSLMGGAVGLVVGVVGIRSLLAITTVGLPRIGDDGAGVGVDLSVVAFTAIVAVMTGVLFGLVPALQGSKQDLSTALKEGSGRAGSGLRQNRVRSILVVGEIALALVLLIGSTLFIRTWIALQSVEPGYNVTNILTTRMSMTGPRFATSSGMEQVIQNGVERLEALPGVERASATCCVPLQGGLGLPFSIVGRPSDGPYHGGGQWAVVSPGFFDVFEIPLRQGRTFTRQDSGSSPPVAIISETMASRFWPDSDPLNDRILIGQGVAEQFDAEVDRQIVGVVGDTREGNLRNEPGIKMYVPQAQMPDTINAFVQQMVPTAWVVRTRGNPQALSLPVQDELRQSTGLPVADASTMSTVVRQSTARQRFSMWLMSVFAGAALLLAAIGVYGLIAYSVEQRAQEIGIRLALGAGTAQVRRMVVFQGMRLVVIGVIIGVASTSGLTRFVASFLFGVEEWDPLAFTVVPAILATVALAAVLLPARRASQVNPIEALRCD